MPRVADPDLPNRIIDAADVLWRTGGDAAVTIRGVAAQAGTTTPTVYSYFKDREALLTALRSVVYQRFRDYMSKATTFAETCERHLEFGERHPREYDLLYGLGWLDRVTPEAQTAEIAAFAQQVVRAGVSESEARRVAYPVLMMLHGTVVHRLSNRRVSGLRSEIRTACLEACMTLLKQAKRSR